MKSILCILGLHKKQVCECKYVLQGFAGKIEAWTCSRCGYKCSDGVFIPEKKINNKYKNSKISL
jgi:ribosomal protein L37AE/L43A